MSILFTKSNSSLKITNKEQQNVQLAALLSNKYAQGLRRCFFKYYILNKKNETFCAVDADADATATRLPPT